MDFQYFSSQPCLITSIPMVPVCSNFKPSSLQSLRQQPPLPWFRRQLLVHHGPHGAQHLRGQVLPEGRSTDLIITLVTMEGTELVYVPF